MSAFAGLEQGSLLSSFDPLSGEYLADPYPLLSGSGSGSGCILLRSN